MDKYELFDYLAQYIRRESLILICDLDGFTVETLETIAAECEIDLKGVSK